MSSSLAIATMTRVRNDDDASILCASLTALSSCGYPVFVADAGSIPTFKDFLSRLPNTTAWEEDPNLVRQIKASMGKAEHSGARFLIYTEPDKREFFTAGLLAYAQSVTESVDVPAVVVATRSETSLKTFPRYQQLTEGLFNRMARALLELPISDYVYGPLLLNVRTTSDFIRHAGEELSWGWRAYVIGRAALAGLPVVPWTTSVPCPSAQRAEDDQPEIVHRLSQLEENIHGLRQALVDDNSWASKRRSSSGIWREVHNE